MALRAATPVFHAAGPVSVGEVVSVNSGDTAWLLASAALVLRMTPGLAFFYGGMVREKSVLNMLMMSVGDEALRPLARRPGLWPGSWRSPPPAPR